jgi:hypothetical protein
MDGRGSRGLEAIGYRFSAVKKGEGTLRTLAMRALSPLMR